MRKVNGDFRATRKLGNGSAKFLAMREAEPVCSIRGRIFIMVKQGTPPNRGGPCDEPPQARAAGASCSRADRQPLEPLWVLGPRGIAGRFVFSVRGGALGRFVVQRAALELYPG